MARDPQPIIRVMRRFSRAAGLVTTVVGALILVGWLFGFRQLQGLLGAEAPITATEASGLLLAGLASTWITTGSRFARLAAWLLLGLGGFTFVELLLGRDFAPITRGAPTVSVAFILLGASLIARARDHDRWADSFAAANFIFVYIGWLSGVLHIQWPIPEHPRVPLGESWMVLYLLLSLGVLLARPGRGGIMIMIGDTASGHMVRRLLALILVAPLLLGLLWRGGERLGLLASPFGLFAFVLANTALGLVLVWWDVLRIEASERERRRAIEEAARAAAELRKVQELNRLKDHFLSSMSHEMRTPLALIVGYTELLEDACPNPELLGGIKEGSRRLTEHIDHILDYSALISGTLPLYQAEVSPPEIARHVAEIVEGRLAQADLELVLEIDPETPTIQADAHRLTQILLELVDNARKVTPAGGKVGLRVMPTAGGVRLDVWDTGPGIPEDRFAQVWEAFSQLEVGDAARLGGLGLGLTIVKMLVALHGGRVGLVSQVGKGSTFTVELPIDTSAPSAGVGGVETGSGATIRGRTRDWNAG